MTIIDLAIALLIRRRQGVAVKVTVLATARRIVIAQIEHELTAIETALSKHPKTTHMDKE